MKEWKHESARQDIVEPRSHDHDHVMIHALRCMSGEKKKVMHIVISSTCHSSPFCPHRQRMAAMKKEIKHEIKKEQMQPNIWDHHFQYIPKAIQSETGKQMLETMDQHMPTERSHFMMFNKQCTVPRDQLLIDLEFPDKPRLYHYSRHAVPTLTFIPPVIQSVTDELLVLFPHFHPSVVLINRYKNGNDSVGWHADDEAVIDQTQPIISVSFGATRDFFVRLVADKSMKQSWALHHLDVLVMNGCDGNTQKLFQHTLPPRKRSQGIRYNLTFRVHNK